MKSRAMFQPHVDTDCEPAVPVDIKVLPVGWKQVGYSYLHRDGLAVIVSESLERDGCMWRHVSLSYANRIPTYGDIKAVKDIFIGQNKLAIQVFPAKSEHVNEHPYCLHLFHCIDKRPIPDFRRNKSL